MVAQGIGDVGMPGQAQDADDAVVKRGQHVPGGLAGRAGCAQCLAVDRDRTPTARRQSCALLGPCSGRVIRGINVQALQGRAERGLVRHPAGDPSPVKVAWSASAAHPVIATNDRAPASTAHTAKARITAIGWRTPRRAPGSGNAASNSKMPRNHAPHLMSPAQ